MQKSCSLVWQTCRENARSAGIGMRAAMKKAVMLLMEVKATLAPVLFKHSPVRSYIVQKHTELNSSSYTRTHSTTYRFILIFRNTAYIQNIMDTWPSHPVVLSELHIPHLSLNAAIITSSHLGRLSTRIWGGGGGDLTSLAIRALVRSGDVTDEDITSPIIAIKHVK